MSGMNKPKENIRIKMNDLGKRGEPFVFLVDFLMNQPLIFPLGDDSGNLLWSTPSMSNSQSLSETPVLQKWELQPVPFELYQNRFEHIQRHIFAGDTYLLNFTQPTAIETNLGLRDIFCISNAPYKVMLKEKFVCFSPEPFVRINNGTISSYPMKGTIDADSDGMGEKVLMDSKELAEHHTIVDLIRNDLSLVAENVRVERFRYLEKISTNRKDLWQVSSEIKGELPEGYPERIGDILFSMLPAGSVSGAPKKKTVEIILEVEAYNRGYYTGVFGVFDGKNLDSCVLIRFIENNGGQLIYKSGGGITFQSESWKEYNEMLEKVYVPIV